GAQRQIGAIAEDLGSLCSNAQELAHPRKLDLSCGPATGKRAPIEGRVGSELGAEPEVDGSSIVGIDQRTIQKLGSLIEVGYPGHGCLQGELGEAVQATEQRDTRSKFAQRADKFAR